VAGGSLLLLGAGCAKPPDLDAEPGGAQVLALGTAHEDALDCRRGDCADWYRVEVPGKGHLVVEVTALGSQAPVPGFGVILADGRGAPVDRAENAGQPSVRLEAQAPDRVAYLVEVERREPRPPLGYRIEARYEPPPPPRAPAPPPKPEFETVRSAVLQVERQDGRVSAVLLESGSGQGMRPGLRGSLLQGGRVIASIEVIDVFPEGSRARVEGALAAPITPSTTAEIEVPVARSRPRPAP
jgi:hypothetical protein